MTETPEVPDPRLTDRNDVKELKQWLAYINCQQYYTKFMENGITVDLIPELDTSSLKELGVTKLGDRLRLEIAIGNQKQEKLMNGIHIDDLYRDLDLQVTSPIRIHSNSSQTDLDGTLIQQGISGTGLSGGISGTGSGGQNISTSISSSNINTTSGTSNKDSNKNITFILSDGSIKRVNVSGCFNAQSIKAKVLKKLGFKSQEAKFDTFIHTPYQVNSDHVFGTGESAVTLLFDVELVTICYSPERLEKHRIMLVPKNEYPTETAIETSRRIMHKYDKLTSSKENNIIHGSGVVNGDNATSGAGNNEGNGVHKNARATMRNFFGQRPPSELISSNLAEYFPEARQKELEQTVRNSVRHSVRLSRRFNIPPGFLGAGIGVPVNNRQSMHSNISTGLRSISSAESAMRRNHRTVGDVMVHSINAIDEAVNSNDTLRALGPPANSQFGDAKSISSNKSMNAGRKALHRISVATDLVADFVDDHVGSRISTIELMDSDSEDEIDDLIDDFSRFGDGNVKDVNNEVEEVEEEESEEEQMGPHSNWLKGARIGSGSFGTVYLGMNPYTGELMAVKQIPLPKEKDGEDHQVEKIMIEQQQEMTLLKELNHENIVRYYGSTTDESFLNIFLEYVPGGSVQSMLNSYGPFEEPLIRNFVRQVAIGLNYLHGEDIIHRDIKGANILIDIKGTVKIGDFGISKKVSSIDEEDEDFKKTGKRGALQGSVFWMAPEVVKQSLYTKKGDIWSIGSLIVEMFTGRHPYPELSQMQALFRIGSLIIPQIPEWCTEEAKEFLTKTFEINHTLRPDAVELLGEPFLNPLIMSKQ
ncbi:STE11 [[Candida] subhashii]|uniref:STE11 n=1 Tax=[Candida] subhashii TaxID=561895 RepID=A0A8J5V0D2_9ASCO|nr:STE11 [[Candida] subhashii]KAG7665390.1 STE11 [[Candida] subhashii]